MIAKLHFTKFFDGQAYLRLDGWDNILTPSELPNEYLATNPRFYAKNNGIAIVVCDTLGNEYTLIRGGEYLNSTIASVISAMKVAGHKLTKINRKKRGEYVYNRWHGTTVVAI